MPLLKKTKLVFNSNEDTQTLHCIIKKTSYQKNVNRLKNNLFEDSQKYFWQKIGLNLTMMWIGG